MRIAELNGLLLGLFITQYIEISEVKLTDGEYYSVHFHEWLLLFWKQNIIFLLRS